MSEQAPLAVCFGEILFDRFEDGDYPGGAPLNFAWYLRQFGVSVTILSAVGRDGLGDAAIDLLDRAGIGGSWVGRRPEPTGTAEVSLCNGQPTYTFPENVAWDHIELPPAQASSGSLVYFGTLAQRTASNRACLARLLASPFQHRVFDVNLRPGYYSEATIADGIARASIVNMNRDEWPVIRRVAGVDAPGQLVERFGLAAAIVTMGSEGAELHAPGGTCRAASAPTLPTDTVGAGDAFCATIAAAAMRGVDLAGALPVACDAGAFVAAHRGAQVELPAELRAALG